mmetsp:Transcript_35104/g.92442  ORF Transcript_35104/g.92442 Transcript_35104/m.92442 type:complete len:95 (-) Transcript_35104:410-694(-)
MSLGDKQVLAFGSWDDWQHPVVLFPSFTRGTSLPTTVVNPHDETQRCNKTVFEARIRLAPGRYQFKFRIKGKWVLMDEAVALRAGWTTVDVPGT